MEKTFKIKTHSNGDSVLVDEGGQGVEDILIFTHIQGRAAHSISNHGNMYIKDNTRGTSFSLFCYQIKQYGNFIAL